MKKEEKEKSEWGKVETDKLQMNVYHTPELLPEPLGTDICRWHGVSRPLLHL